MRKPRNIRIGPNLMFPLLIPIFLYARQLCFARFSHGCVHVCVCMCPSVTLCSPIKGARPSNLCGGTDIARMDNVAPDRKGGYRETTWSNPKRRIKLTLIPRNPYSVKHWMNFDTRFVRKISANQQNAAVLNRNIP